MADYDDPLDIRCSAALERLHAKYPNHRIPLGESELTYFYDNLRASADYRAATGADRMRMEEVKLREEENTKYGEASDAIDIARQEAAIRRDNYDGD